MGAHAQVLLVLPGMRAGLRAIHRPVRIPWTATRSTSSIARPVTLSANWRQLRPRHWSCTPSERDTIAQSRGNMVRREIEEWELTGINLDALAFCAAQLLSTQERPHISLFDTGGNNRIYLLRFADARVDLIARVPLSSSNSRLRVPATAASMAFARHVLRIPCPKLLAWSGDYNNGVGAPFILTEFIEDVADTPWHLLASDNPADNYDIIEGVAQWDHIFLRPLSERLQRVGDLAFTSNADDLSDEGSYEIVPLRLLLHDVTPTTSLSSARFSSFSSRCLTLEGLWMELWRHQRDAWLAHPCGSDTIDIDWPRYNAEDGNSSVQPVALSAFSEVAGDVLLLATRVLTSLCRSPSLSLSCLSREDHAFRNVLFGRHLQVRAFIDWDDTHVLPFALAFHMPDEIMHYVPMGLPSDTSWRTEGEFVSLPPDAPGPDPRPIYDENGIREDTSLIRDMSLRRRYKKAVSQLDMRLADPAMPRARDDAVRVHNLLTAGGSLWWRKRAWLRRKVNHQL